MLTKLLGKLSPDKAPCEADNFDQQVTFDV